jgi:site-specific DNA recombinase
MGKRILGAARLSHDTDKSTSIERQTEQLTHMAAARGDTLVHVTVDTDVSGSVSPFDRDGLGPWLTEPMLSKWDVLMVAKLDRLTRDLDHFRELIRWCETNGKTLVSVAESLDFSTAAGRMFAGILAQFAEFERERMSERRKEAADKARLDGRYDGRKGPFGYAAEPVTRRLVQDPLYGPLGRQMANWRIDGRTYAWISRELEKSDARPRESDKWTDDLVRKILENPGLNGQIVKWTIKKGEPRSFAILRGPDGMPLKFTDNPVLDDETWLKLSKATARKPAAKRDGTFMLTHVAYCGNCARPLYGSRRGERYAYYRCRSLSVKTMTCGSPLIPLAELEAEVEAALLARWGDRELFMREIRPGANHDAEIENVRSQIDAIESENYSDPAEIKVSIRMLAKLEAQIEHLKSLPVDDGGEEWTPAGMAMRDYYLSLNVDGRSHLLEKWGVRVMAKSDGRSGGGGLHIAVSLGDPEGFEQASGLILRHEQDDHIPTYLVAGVLFRRHDDGTMEVYREPWKAAVMGTFRQWHDLTHGEPKSSNAGDQS